MGMTNTKGPSMNAITTDKVSDDFWFVMEGEVRIGTVVGGGPTAQTRFKAIAMSNDAIDPDAAPGSYHRTLNEAAASLRGSWPSRLLPAQSHTW